MTMINCDREFFKRVLEERVPTTAEARVLDAAARLAGFRHLDQGRRICPRTWLTALRARTRGHVALTGLWRQSVYAHEVLARQAAILDQLIIDCPAFFAGLLVPSRDDAAAADGPDARGC